MNLRVTVDTIEHGRLDDRTGDHVELLDNMIAMLDFYKGSPELIPEGGLQITISKKEMQTFLSENLSDRLTEWANSTGETVTDKIDRILRGEYRDKAEEKQMKSIQNYGRGPGKFRDFFKIKD